MTDRNPAAQPRAMLDSGSLVAAPGAPDSLSARLVQNSGFEAVYMTDSFPLIQPGLS